MLNLKAAAFGAMSLVLFTGALAVGQDRRDDGRAPKKDEIEKKAEKPAALSDQDLCDMLTKLGQAPKEIKGTNGSPMYGILVNVDNRNITVYVSRSSDGTKIWLGAFFSLNGAIPADVQQGMLEANAKHGPAHFGIFTGSKMYSLSMPLDNRGLTPEEVQRQIGTFSNVLRQTEPLWNSAKWAPQGGAK
jgi:hypothetical protein